MQNELYSFDVIGDFKAVVEELPKPGYGGYEGFAYEGDDPHVNQIAHLTGYDPELMRAMLIELIEERL